MWFLKYSNGRTTTWAFSADTDGSCELDEAGLLPPNRKSASPLRNTTNGIRSWRSAFKVGWDNCCQYTWSAAEAQGHCKSPNPLESHQPENCSQKYKQCMCPRYPVH